MQAVNLNEAVTYLRELLYMNKDELDRETDIDGRKIKKLDKILFAFERNFDPHTKLPYGATPRQGG